MDDDKAFELSKEIAKIAMDNGMSVEALIEEYKKAHNSTDQSKSYEPTKQSMTLYH